MKKTMWRLLAATMASAMLATCLASCNGDKGDNDNSKENPYSSVVEVGTEKELTAVRDNLIKATETKGLGEITKMELYENGARTTSDQYVQVKDNKKFYYSGDIKRMVNYPDGYIIDVPADWKPDFSLATLRVRFDTDEVSLLASREDNAIRYHGGFDNYLTALYLFVGNADSQKNNGISVVEPRKTVQINDEWSASVYRLKIDNCPETIKAYYTYVDYFNTAKNATYHFMFKAVDDRDFSNVYMTFQGIFDKGAAVDTKLYPEEANPNWSEETKAHYEGLLAQDYVDWGLFAYKLQSTGWKVTIPMLEKKVDYTFPVISEYSHFSSMGKANGFPLEFGQKVVADGDRMMQFTFQYTDNNNMDLTHYNPIMDIYRETDDAIAVLTDYAKGAAEFGQPFYFRLNNEMNTDWTSYCPMANMLDPDIFAETWITLYDIFTETGANQYAIWVFNGFDHSYPPYNWADYRCLMPEANYIDMIGLTGYNFVTPENTTTWESFEAKYDKISAAYSQYFGDWAWIISEFGCETSTNPDQSKATWVKEMFETLDTNRYPQLKVAVWFNCSDYDQQGNVTNDLNLEKDPEVVQAFKEGLELTQP